MVSFEMCVMPVRGHKRRRNEDQWKQNVRKRMRNSGLSYTASNGKETERKRLKQHICGKCAASRGYL